MIVLWFPFPGRYTVSNTMYVDSNNQHSIQNKKDVVKLGSVPQHRQSITHNSTVTVTH